MRQRADGLDGLFVESRAELVQEEREKDRRRKNKEVPEQHEHPSVLECFPEVAEVHEESEVFKADPSPETARTVVRKGHQNADHRQIVKHHEVDKWREKHEVEHDVARGKDTTPTPACVHRGHLLRLSCEKLRLQATVPAAGQICSYISVLQNQ